MLPSDSGVRQAYEAVAGRRRSCSDWRGSAALRLQLSVLFAGAGKRELANWLIGLNASLAGAGILIVGPFLPRRSTGSASTDSSPLLFAGCASSPSRDPRRRPRRRLVCGALRHGHLLRGAVDDDRDLAERRRRRPPSRPDHRRFGTLYALCQFVGPVILGVTGVVGPMPLIVAMVPLAVGALLRHSIRSRRRPARTSEPHAHTPRLRAARPLGGPSSSRRSSPASARRRCRASCRSMALRTA